MTDFEALLGALDGCGVECIVVGGAAALAHGSARFTQDLDIVYRRTPENLIRLVSALRDQQPYPRGAPPGHIKARVASSCKSLAAKSGV